MTHDTEGLQKTLFSEAAMIDYANDALETEERIDMARLLSKRPTEAAETFGYIADRDELLLALGVRHNTADDPTLPALLPPRKVPGRKRGISLGYGISLATVALTIGGALMTFTGPQRSVDALVHDALRANDLAQLRLTMASMDEDTMVDTSEIQRLAGIALPAHPANWVLRDTQVIPSDDGVSVLRTFEIANDGLVTLYVVRGKSDAPQGPDRLALAGGQGAWFRHAGSEYVLIGRHARAPLDDEAALLLASLTPA